MMQCTYCQKEIKEESFVTTGFGKAHRLCYEENHAPKEKVDFKSLLSGAEDPFLLRQLLNENLTEEQKNYILNSYNKISKENHEKLIKRLK